MTRRQGVALATTIVLVTLAAIGLAAFQRAKAGYEGYRERIQPGITVAGIDVGWRTPDEARRILSERLAEPYYSSITLLYQDQEIRLSPADDLSLEVDVESMVEQAFEASHRTDYWTGFGEWLQGEAVALSLDVPLAMDFDPKAAEAFLARAADQFDRTAVEPMIDVEEHTFIPGRPGRRLDVETAAEQVNEAVPDPSQRELVLPVSSVDPDQSPARIESMLRTLGPVMDAAPEAPSFFTATLPLSTTGGLAGTPTVTYTGELTWTFPHFSGYQGPLTTTYGFFFDPGTPGMRFDVEQAIDQVNAALEAGATDPIRFSAEAVPPPPIARGLLVSPLEDRLAGFPGVYSLLVKDLDTGEVVYDHRTKIVLSGMSVVKIGIMVEVYSATKGAPDQQTRDELTAMLGSESCNPCANRLMALLGSGSASAGAQRVTRAMQRLGLSNFRLCGPYRIETGREPRDGIQVASIGLGSAPGLAGQAPGGRLVAQAGGSATPGYDRCVHATPREMADLLEMIYSCTQAKGRLPQADRTAFTPRVCQEMIDIMAANDLRNMLGAGIPEQVKLAHKHGFAGYDAPWGDTRAEVGIVFSPGATWLVSLYIWEDSPWIDYGVVQPLYRDVTNLLYNYFNPNEPYWPLPPWVPPPEPPTPPP